MERGKINQKKSKVKRIIVFVLVILILFSVFILVIYLFGLFLAFILVMHFDCFSVGCFDTVFILLCIMFHLEFCLAEIILQLKISQESHKII